MTPDTITIGGREFRVGAWYEHASTMPGRGKSKRFLGLHESLSDTVSYIGPRGGIRRGSVRWWLEVAGDEVAP